MTEPIDLDRRLLREAWPGVPDRYFDPPEELPPYVPEPTGAYRLWLKELAAKKRTPTTFDTLWRAACHECAGLDYRRQGLVGMAIDEFDLADKIILEGMT